MKILCLIPPYIPSYFNAGHHLPLFQVASYLQCHRPQYEIKSHDCAALNTTWKEICDMLCQSYDLIVLMNDFDGVDTFERFVHYRNQLAPHSQILTFGRLSKLIPRFFFKLGINAVHVDGDYEAGVIDYVQAMENETLPVAGVLTSAQEKLTKGRYLSVEEWVLPDVRQIPYAAYSQLYKNDFNKFCGIPERQELVVPVARGCPVGCAYCDVPMMQGKNERRLAIDVTVDYIQQSFKQLPFEYVSFYAPTFTLNRKWVEKLCQRLQSLPRRYPWKCVTVLKTLNERLIAMMSRSGCVRISLGLESFTRSTAGSLPKVKQDTLATFKSIARICNRYGVELNCFIMLGMPEDTPEDIKQTIDICLEHHARVRPTIYTPYHLLKDDMTLAQVNQFNRQLFPEKSIPHELANAYYQLFYNNPSDKKTQIMDKIAVA